MKRKLFGVEPALLVGVIEAVLALLVVLGWVTLTREETGAVMGIVVLVFAFVSAAFTVDTLFAFLVDLVKAIGIAVVAFGGTFSPELTAAIITVIVTLGAVFTRTQTSPAEAPSLRLVPAGAAVDRPRAA